MSNTLQPVVGRIYVVRNGMIAASGRTMDLADRRLLVRRLLSWNTLVAELQLERRYGRTEDVALVEVAFARGRRVVVEHLGIDRYELGGCWRDLTVADVPSGVFP